MCWSLFLLCREKAASLLEEISQFLLNLEVDQKQHNGRHLKVCWSTWLHWGGEHRHVISQPFHFQEDSFCDCVIIRNLHPWGFMTRIITELHGQERGGKRVCKGPEQVLNHRSSLWLSHSPISDFWRLLSCWAICYARANDSSWQNNNQLVFFFPMKHLLLWVICCGIWPATNCLTFKKIWEIYKCMVIKFAISSFTFL